MRTHRPTRALALLLALALAAGLYPASALARTAPSGQPTGAGVLMARELKKREQRITPTDREKAAERVSALQSAAAESTLAAAALPTLRPGDLPDYFGMANWAYSPPLRKFVDGLPGLGPRNANNLGQYIPVAVPDTITYPGSDYYEIELREYSERLHSDLPPTRLRGYVQVNYGTDASGHNTIAPAPIHYLGPMIVARKDRPVRVKFTNKLPTGAGGDLFIPVDTTVMGAGMGPLGEAGGNYTQNRATIHLHGGKTVWISDGTPHQWITPAGEDTPYPKGVSVRNVPDMPDPGDGSMTFFYSNQQSARLLWYHDHAFGITRLNVYAGMAAPYLLEDETERELVSSGVLPSEQIPLIIQDKTFVDATTITQTDPTWEWGTGADGNGDGYPDPRTGDLWMPHVYVPAQNPYDPTGANPYGRWHYGPWFWPPTPVAQGPVDNPYYDPVNAPWEPPKIPGTPHPSMGMESFFDTALVNGTAYPTLEVEPKAYRFRVLNAANDRFFNLQLYQAVSSNTVRRQAGADRYATAVAAAAQAFPGWEGVAHVVVASGETASQVDALAAAGLAGVYDAPLLLVKRDSVPEVTRSAIAAMSAGVRVHIVGGQAAVTPAVARALQSVPGVAGVDRVAGPNRYATAAAVAGRMKAVLGAAFVPEGFIVNGADAANFYDSLVAGPAAYAMHRPILLVGKSVVPAETAAALNSLGVTRRYIVGGTAAVDSAVALTLGVAPADRIAGPDRYATAAAFANRAVAAGWLTFDAVGVAAATVDTLAGGVAMGRLGGPMLLGATSALPPTTQNLLRSVRWDVLDANVYGGTAVVSPQTYAAVVKALENLSEVRMVPASATPGFPETWPTDGRAGGVPDPKTAGPDFVQIGTEGGFLPMPAVLEQQPITWVSDPTVFNVGNVDLHTLLLAPAERADVIVDFSKFAGKTLILYNDAPAAFPALDPRYDYYTGSPDLTDTGGYWGTRPARGPNTRTIMQIKVKASAPAPAYDRARLNAEFRSTATHQGVFERSQNPIIVGQAAYNPAYHGADFSPRWPDWGVVNIQDNQIRFETLAGTIATVPLEPKAIQDEMGEAFDPEFGRMSGKLGLEMPFTMAGRQNFVLQNFTDPPTEILFDAVETTIAPALGDGVQIWKITHNGVDTHPIHFHLYDVQVINRVGWDGIIRMPDANELGWKDTLRVSPLEDTIVAMRPTAPKLPWGVPDSIRPLNPAADLGTTDGLTQVDPRTGQPRVLVNQMYDFGWEYVIHCHILSHEEMDMMRPMEFRVGRALAGAPVLAASGTPGSDVTLQWTDATPWDGYGPISTLGDLSNEIGFRIERSPTGADDWTVIGRALANQTTFVDTTTSLGTGYDYRVVAYNMAGDTLSNVVTVLP
jgi:FtsP/CotA-like multicopper oxidase with cupredoxin domain